MSERGNIAYWIGRFVAENGGPRPDWDTYEGLDGHNILSKNLANQQRGWDDYHAQEQSR